MLIQTSNTGAFRFVVPGIARAGPSGTYSSVVSHLKGNRDKKVLDLGCCFGHDARQLLKDGVNPDQVVACDLVPELIKLGFELFGDEKDESHLKGLRWETVDVFKQSDVDKIRTSGGYHAIYVGSFIHLFPLDWQQKTVTVLDSLLSKEKGSVIWGRQVGTKEGVSGPRDRIEKGSRGPTGVDESEDGTKDSPYYHDVNTLQKLFDDTRPGQWEANVDLYDWKMERGSTDNPGDGAQMIDPKMIPLMKRLSFAFVRK